MDQALNNGHKYGKHNDLYIFSPDISTGATELLIFLFKLVLLRAFFKLMSSWLVPMEDCFYIPLL
jgi:hypothetical protein